MYILPVFDYTLGIFFDRVIGLFLLLVRTIIKYTSLIAGLRFTGKRQLGELSASEFAVTMLVSELAAVPLQDAALPLAAGLLPLAALLSAEVVLSYVCRYSLRARQLLCGNPCIVIRNGVLDEQMLSRLRLSPDDILDGLRTAGVPQIRDVQYGIVETSGQLNVIAYREHQPVTPSDLGCHPEAAGLPVALISDGTVLHEHLYQFGKSEAWLLSQCRRHGAHGFEDVFLLTLDDCGNLFCQKKAGTGGAG